MPGDYWNPQTNSYQTTPYQRPSTISALPDISGWDENKLRNYMQTVQGTLNSSNPNPSDTANLQGQLGVLQNELQNRTIANNTAQSRSDIFNSFGDTGAASDQRTRDAIDQVFGNQQDVQTRNLNDLYNTQRGNAIEEAAANGNSRQPAFQASLANGIDANRGRAMSDLFSNLGAAKGQAVVGNENNIQNRNLSRASSMAGLLTGQNNFGTSLGTNTGLAQQTFNAGQRQQAMDNLFNQQTLDQAKLLGQAQANGQQNNGLAGAGGGALSGAATGTAITPGWGTAIGAGLGGLTGWLSTKR